MRKTRTESPGRSLKHWRNLKEVRRVVSDNAELCCRRSLQHNKHYRSAPLRCSPPLRPAALMRSLASRTIRCATPPAGGWRKVSRCLCCSSYRRLSRLTAGHCLLLSQLQRRTHLDTEALSLAGKLRLHHSKTLDVLNNVLAVSRFAQVFLRLHAAFAGELGWVVLKSARRSPPLMLG